MAKNTPKVNKLLQEVLHLVTIQPFKLPENLPSKLDMSNHLVLTSNGEMIMGSVEVLGASGSHIESITVSDTNDNTNLSTKINNIKSSEEITEGKKDLNNTTNMPKAFKLHPDVSKWTLSNETVQKDLNRILLLNKLNIEQFPTHYKYKYNQDGKMHRYYAEKKFDKDYS